MKTTRTELDPSIQGAAKAGKRERSFELSLPALVIGLDAAGKPFEERTTLHAISAEEISFPLRARLLIGSKVTVTLDIPRTLILENPLRLLVSGDVVFVRIEEGNGRDQFISARLNRSFRLRPGVFSQS